MSFNAANREAAASLDVRETAFMFAKECAFEWIGTHGLTDIDTLADALINKLEESAVGNDLGQSVRRSVAEEAAAEAVYVESQQSR